MSKIRMISSWVLVVLLAGLFGLAGAGKFTAPAVEMFAGWGYAPWFATLIGVLELAGAVGLLVPRLMRLAVYGLTIIMLGAAYTHLTNGEGPDTVRPVIFLVFMWLAWWLRGPRRAETTETA